MTKRVASVLFFAAIIFFTLFISSDYAQATGSERRTAPVGGLAIIIILICVLTRKNPIGGWLLYYLIQLVLGILIALVLSASMFNSSDYLPANWPDKIAYAAFLLSSVPPFLLRIIEAFIILPSIWQSARDWPVIIRLKRVLWWELAAAILAFGLDLIYWKENLVFDVLALIWPIIWIPYFSRSTRIKRVFGGLPTTNPPTEIGGQSELSIPDDKR